MSILREEGMKWIRTETSGQLRVNTGRGTSNIHSKTAGFMLGNRCRIQNNAEIRDHPE